MNRWKPEEGERYYFIDALWNVQWYLWNSATDVLYYKAGNCFKTEEEAQHVSILIKKLLQENTLRDKSVVEDCNSLETNCSQLPKLTAEVFDRPDCPKWAKYAVVAADGTAWWYSKRPFFNIHNNMWCTDYCHRIIEGEYDASDWQNSLIERLTKLPKLTAEVFDRPDCPKWAKYAVVDMDGSAGWYRKKPSFNIYNNKWYPDLTDSCSRIIEGEYDASDWQNSLIERLTKLPE